MKLITWRPALAWLFIAIGAILSMVLAAPSFANQTSEQYAQSGESKFAKQDYDGALADFRAGITADPKDESNHINAGLALLAKHQPGEALDYFNQAITLSPKSPEAYLGRGQALYALGRKAEAKASFQIVWKLEPDDPGAKYFLDQLK